jgi:hypothetical protein
LRYSRTDNENLDEWLYKYNLDTKEKILIEKLSSNKIAADQNQLFYWQDSVFVANEERIIKINPEDDSYDDISIVRPEWNLYSHSILCGNYIYYYVPYGEVNMLCDGRYNLITKEYEDFDWQQYFE